MKTARRKNNPAALDIIAALNDPLIFGPFFRGQTWSAWRSFLAALFALPMTDDQMAVYRQHTGRSAPPTVPSSEAWLVLVGAAANPLHWRRSRSSSRVSATGDRILVRANAAPS
jgi:hypothetical protein